MKDDVKTIIDDQFFDATNLQARNPKKVLASNGKRMKKKLKVDE